MQPDFAPLFSFTPILVFLAFAGALAVYLWYFRAGTKAFCARVHHWLGEPRADLVQAHNQCPLAAGGFRADFHAVRLVRANP